MVIVETEEQFQKFLQEFENNDSIVIPIFSDSKAHPAVNKVCLLYFWFPTDKAFVLPFNHSQALNLSLDYLDRIQPCHGKMYTPSKKALMHAVPFGKDSFDLKSTEHSAFGTILEEDKLYPLLMRQMVNQFFKYTGLVRAIPLMKLIEFCETICDHYAQIMSANPEHPEFNNNVIIPTAYFMEKEGIKVDPVLFEKHFGSKLKGNIVNGLVYTEYNPYTVAGRVTSRFGGVNYSALHSSDGSRNTFISRYQNGSMVLIDFESFHVRLIAELIGFELPTTPIHDYFGRQYFETETLTEEQYEESKQTTFKYLYSTRREGMDYPFFKAVYDFVDDMWSTLQESGVYVSPKGRKLYLKHIENPNPGKVFNYILQMLETEVAFSGINGLIPIFEGKKSIPVMYTYDSLLIDFQPYDGVTFIQDIIKILEQDGKYPVRVYAGPSYGELVNVTSAYKT